MNVIRKIAFFTAFIIPAIVILGYSLGGYWNFLAIIDVFLIIPLLDHWLGIDTKNVPSKLVSKKSNDYYYRFVTYLWTYFQLGFLAWGIYVIALNNFGNISAWIGFTISFSLVTGGIGITVAHELGHKKSKIERLYSRILLATVCYMHFYIEHNKGHHIHVATREDPATSRKNENFFAFWFRSVFKGYQHAWQIENERLKRLQLSPLHYKNNMIWFTFTPVLAISIITTIISISFGYFTWQVPVFFFTQSVLGFTLLELVNYVEHYGMLRKKEEMGGYERVTPLHSWNASHLLSNFFLFQLQRHSDHHANAIKRYQILNHYDESPQLPAGYPTMIILALVPPLWFYIMNKRLQQWQDHTKPVFSR